MDEKAEEFVEGEEKKKARTEEDTGKEEKEPVDDNEGADIKEGN